MSKAGPSIRVSKKHGVNPMLVQCFWCGKDTNEIALLGYLPGDVAAPMHGILNHEPCDTCKENMAKGIAVIEMTQEGVGARPTGRWWVLTREAVERMIQPPELLASILEKGRVNLLPETAQELGLYDLPTQETPA